MSRTSSLARHGALFLALRGGEVSFDRVVREVRPDLEARAGWFLRRWSWSGQGSEAAEDLVQEMLLALWRAVDSWDPARAPLLAYVDASVGRAVTARLRRATGRPDKRRAPPARQRYAEDLRARGRDGDDREDPDRLSAVLGLVVEADQEDHADAPALLLEVLADLSRHDRAVVELIASGMTADEAGRRVYADKDMRIRCRFDCEDDALREARAAVRRAARVAEA